MVRKPRSKKLFTIGYEQTPPKAVLDELQNAGVKLLVDVRAVVSSRRPGFSKNQLAAALDERGISYIHMKGLGTPKEGRLAARSGDIKTLQRIYAKHLKTPQAKEELDELASLVMKAGPVCLLVLRARSPELPPQMDRGDHRRPRRRQNRKSAAAATLSLRYSITLRSIARRSETPRI